MDDGSAEGCHVGWFVMAAVKFELMIRILVESKDQMMAALLEIEGVD